MTGRGKLSIRDTQGLLRLARDPVAFCAHILNLPLLPFQAEAATLLRDRKRVAVATAPGVGKTAMLAGICLWFVVANPGSRVITTGPTWHHVESVLWPEIHRRYHGAAFPIGGKLNATKLDLGDSQAYGISTNEPAAFGGVHARRQLIAFDDAHGIPSSIYAITRDNLMSGEGCYWMLVGNPLPWAVRDFREAFRPGSGFVTVSMSALDHPNVKERREVIPGAVSWQKVDRIRETNGVESREWKIEVLGEWAEGAEDVLVPMQWLEAAALVTPQTKEPPHMGVDIARQGSDYSVATITKDRCVMAQESWQDADLMGSCGRIISLAVRYGIKPENIHIDSIGVGGGVVDRLREQGYAVDAVNFAESACGDWTDVLGQVSLKNRRAELHWAARELVRRKELCIPVKYAETWRDLSAPWFKHDSAGRLYVQPKEDLKVSLGCSPDYGDSLCLSLSRSNSASLIAWV